MNRKPMKCLGLALALLLALGIAPTAEAQVSVGILIDAGGDMDRLMDKANEGIEELLDELDDDDEVFVLSFGQTTSVVFELTSDVDKDDVGRAIGRISTSRGQPSLFPTLQVAYEILEGASNERQALVIVTTGGIVGADLGRSRELVRQHSRFVPGLSPESPHVLVYGVGMPTSSRGVGPGPARPTGDAGARDPGARADPGASSRDQTAPGGARSTSRGDFDMAVAAEEALRSFADATGAGYGVKPQVGNRLSRYNVKDIFEQIAGHLKQ